MVNAGPIEGRLHTRHARPNPAYPAASCRQETATPLLPSRSGHSRFRSPSLCPRDGTMSLTLSFSGMLREWHSIVWKKKHFLYQKTEASFSGSHHPSTSYNKKNERIINENIHNKNWSISINPPSKSSFLRLQKNNYLFGNRFSCFRSGECQGLLC